MALGQAKKACGDFTIPLEDLEKQKQVFELTRSTLEIRRNMLSTAMRKCADIKTNMKASPFEVALNVSRARNQAKLIANIDRFIGFYSRFENIYGLLIDTREHLKHMQDARVDSAELAKLQGQMNEAMVAIQKAEANLQNLEAHGATITDIIGDGNGAEVDETTREIQALIEQIQLAEATGDAEKARELHAQYDQRIAELA